MGKNNLTMSQEIKVHVIIAKVFWGLFFLSIFSFLFNIYFIRYGEAFFFFLPICWFWFRNLWHLVTFELSIRSFLFLLYIFFKLILYVFLENLQTLTILCLFFFFLQRQFLRFHNFSLRLDKPNTHTNKRTL